MEKKYEEFEVVYSVIDRYSGHIYEENSMLDVFALNERHARAKALFLLHSRTHYRSPIITIHEVLQLPDSS